MVPHPKDWRPNEMLQSRYDFGADMENPISSFFVTDFGTYTHEPADDDSIFFSPKKNPRKIKLLGHGNFNNAKALAIKHHEVLLNPPTARNIAPDPYVEKLLKALSKDRTLKINKHRGEPSGCRDYPNGQLVQFFLRGRLAEEEPAVMLVVELHGTEDEGVLEDEAEELQLSRNPEQAAESILKFIQDFTRKHQERIGPIPPEKTSLSTFPFPRT